MANSILTGAPRNPSVGSSSNPLQILQQFQQFRNQFQGDPKKVIDQMLQSGRISESQLQTAMQMANQFRSLVK